MFYNYPNPYGMPDPFMMYNGYPPQGRPPFPPPFYGPPPMFQQGPPPFYNQKSFIQGQLPQGQPPQGQLHPFLTNKDGNFGFGNLKTMAGHAMTGYNTFKQLGSIMSLFKL